MTLNVAFYGAGPRAQPYLQALARRPDIAVTAVCDSDRRAAEQTAAGWGAQLYLSYEAMLKEARPQALWICVAPQMQGDVILQATELRIPFFVEPPAAPNYERARICDQRISEANLVAAVGYTNRYTDIVLEAREYLGANPIPLALAWWLSRPHESSPATAEQLLWTEACRFVDVLRQFCGEVERVRSLQAGKESNAGGLVVQLEFASGTVGVLTCTTFARPESKQELELMGEGWSLGFGEGLTTLRLAERDKTTILRCLNVPAADQVQEFLAAAVTGVPQAITSSYSNALRTLAVCHAAALSTRQDRPVLVTEVEQLAGD
jgi:predicted dehydrogenase